MLWLDEPDTDEIWLAVEELNTTEHAWAKPCLREGFAESAVCVDTGP